MSHLLCISRSVFRLEDKFDFLHFGSGRRPLKPGTMFQKLTGYENPTDIFYPGNELYIHFHSDPVQTFDGFWIQLTPIFGRGKKEKFTFDVNIHLFFNGLLKKHAQLYPKG